MADGESSRTEGSPKGSEPQDRSRHSSQEAHSLPATVAWQSRDFRFYSAARFIGVMGAEAQSVGVAWQVYQVTHSPLALGYTGLALFLPGIFFVLLAGHVADRFDRRVVLLSCYVLQFAATALLLWMSLESPGNVWWIYAVLFVIGTGRCFSGPAASALLPTLLPREHFVNAVTWGATIFQVANATGPMVGGLLFTVALAKTGAMTRWNGAPLVYCFTLFALACYLVFMGSVRPAAGSGGTAPEKKGFTMQTVFAGIRYVAGTRLLLGSISLDLFAVLLGGAVSLMPVFAKDILHEGPHGLGLLRAAPSVGSLLVSLLLILVPLRKGAGKIMLFCVGLFGAATVVFGLSRTLWISLLALFITGATDMVSVVVRSSILQLATPPEMRGRVSSVNWLFLGASNEFGEFESGLTAHWWGAVRAVLVGGIASMAVTGLWSVFFPALRQADKLTADSLIAAEKEISERQPEPFA